MLKLIALMGLLAFARNDAPDCTLVATLNASPTAVKGTPAERTAAARKSLVDHIKSRPKGAKIIVTPEAYLTQPPGDEDFASAKDALPHAEEIPADPKQWTMAAHPTLVTFSALAVEAKAFLHINLLEKEGEKVYNTTVAFAPDGTVAAKHRKVHLYKGTKGDETKYITPGKRVVTWYDAKSVGLGKIGLVTCSDIYDPGAGEKRDDPNHLMELHRKTAGLSAVAISACWMMPIDDELGTRGWTPGHFFNETATYVNAAEGLTDAGRYVASVAPGATYDPPPAKKPKTDANVYLLVSNQTAFAPSAGILGPDGKRASPNSFSADKRDVWLTSCIPQPGRAGKPVDPKKPH